MTLEASHQMESNVPHKIEDWVNLLDFDAIADPFDKIAECQYFLNLASQEPDIQYFRWLISAFLGAAYSFFDISALSAYHAFTDPKTGESVEDVEALEKLRRFVTINRKGKMVTTGGLHKVTMQLYKLRKENTHHFPLSVMVADQEPPEAFYFGYVAGQGVPALPFCREVMALMREVHQELQE